MRVRVANSSREFTAAPDEPLLEAAGRASLNVPHSCRGGNCGLCKARLLSGEIHYPHGTPLGLSDAQLDARYVLLCQAQARSDLVLDVQEVRAADSEGLLRLPCRIERVEQAAHDVMMLWLRPPPAVQFSFHAGQYVDVLLPDGRRRSFSVASAPEDARLLELHVRRVPGGAWSEWLFANGASGELVTIEGPLGRFYYREPAAAADPVLLVGGGTGLAPLLSIVRHLINSASTREVMLYWGVRNARDRYAETAVRELLARAPGLRYVCVLSEPDSDWQGRRGLVTAAVLEDLDDLSAIDVYAAGPPAMVEALREMFPRRHAAPERLYCDSFDYARDAPARQSSSAATKS